MTEIPNNIDDSIRFAAELIRTSKCAVILTGAGISTQSGIPDFRSENTGLWSYDEPMEVASLETFRCHPERFFEWMRPLINSIFNAQPNAAHLAIARMEMAGFIKTIITQNIDGLHQKAGSEKVFETHGSLQSMSCTHCFQKCTTAPFIQALVEDHQLPLCPKCNGLLKPDVILFGEQLPHVPWDAALLAARNCDLMLVLGSSLEVLPAAGLPMQALDRGAHLVIINNTPTYLGVRADVVINEDIVKVVPAIADRVLNN
jgi:NAD-dependent deacetylase